MLNENSIFAHLLKKGTKKHLDARVAELVDALVSNTSGAIRAGSSPAPGTTEPSQEGFFV